ncbi:WHG domain-containing protein [Agromyces sp. G08B096]|uniref:WHG domain-containing protein n=1 Tax=Agromyces sp. G08B096 TaxID=3156399 RepID=A0AAU7W833_9MICO
MPRAGLSRDAVVAAALEFVDSAGVDGFDRLTLAAIAERTGVAVPSLYKHVTGLDEVRRGVALGAVQALRRSVDAEAVGRSGADALGAVARGIRTFARQHPGWYAAVQVAPALRAAAEASGGGWPERELAEESDGLLASLAAVLRGFGLPAEREVDAVRLLRSAVHGFVALELGGGFGLPDDLDRSFEVVVAAAVAGVERLSESA